MEVLFGLAIVGMIDGHFPNVDIDEIRNRVLWYYWMKYLVNIQSKNVGLDADGPI